MFMTSSTSNFSPNTIIEIRGTQYQFLGKSANPTEIFVDKTGGRAAIYRLKNTVTESIHALKVFNEDVRGGYSLASFEYFQKSLGHIPAFAWVSERLMLTKQTDRELIAKHPELQNAILMPWFDGEKLDQIREKIHTKKLTVTTTECTDMARQMAATLSELEKLGIAHGDIANSNVMLFWEQKYLVIIDIEDMYHASLSNPDAGQRGGTNGYQFLNPFDPWCAEADRFAGAVYISELLTLTDQACLSAAREEQFFKQDDLEYRTEDDDNEQRAALLSAVQKSKAKFYELLHNALYTTDLTKLPKLQQWTNTLGVFDFSTIIGLLKRVSTIQQAKIAPVKEIEPEPILPPPSRTYEPYKRRATSDDPILMIMMLDLSRSMFRYYIDNQLRITVACDVMNRLITTMYERSIKGDVKLRPRYHVSILGYHMDNKSILTKSNVNLAGENNKSHPANIDDGIFPITMLRGEKETRITPSLINDSIRAGESLEDYPRGGTHMTQAFLAVEELLTRNINTYKDSHPPYIFHITDGANNDSGNPAIVFNRITNMSTKYGNTLVSTAYIGEELIPSNTAVRQWKGITPEHRFTGERVEAANSIRALSSKIPLIYHQQLTGQSGYKELSPNMHMLFPGTDKDMLDLALSMSTTTGNAG
jgi:serine/threonine protein kinase